MTHTCCAICRGEATAPDKDMDGCDFDCGCACDACEAEYQAAYEAERDEHLRAAAEDARVERALERWRGCDGD